MDSNKIGTIFTNGMSCTENGGLASYDIDYTRFFSPLCSKQPHYFAKQFYAKVAILPGDPYKFASGNPSPEISPFAEMSVTLKNGMSFSIKDDEMRDCVDIKQSKGYEPLVKLLKQFQDIFHGNQPWAKNDIFMTCGSQDGLYKFFEAFVSSDDLIIVPRPIYSGVLGALKFINPEYLELPCDDYGVCPNDLSSMLAERKQNNLPMPKILYICPTGANPMGAILPTRRKREIYKLACEYNLLIMEDDPYFLLYFDKNENPVSFLSMDTQGRVVRFDSFSKVISAGFRVGYVTAAKEIIDKIEMFSDVSSVTSVPAQVLIYKTLTTLGLEGYINQTNKVRDSYNRNRICIMKSLEKHVTGIAEWNLPEAGMFIWLKVKNMDHVSEEFVEKCLKKLVAIVPGFVYVANNKVDPHIRLSYSMIPTEKIDKGIEIFAEILREELNEKKTTKLQNL